MRFCKKLHSAILNIHHFHTVTKKCSFGRRVKIEGTVSFGSHIAFDDNVEVRNRTKYLSTIDDYTSINRNTVIRGYFRIGKNCAIAPNCSIIGINHGFSDLATPIKKQPLTSKGGITIEDDVWIGANCVILDGVVIGKGCVIGAGSVVTKSIPAYSIAFGNPCKVFKSRE